MELETFDKNGFWYLLKKENSRYVFVNCEQSFLGYSRLIKLSNEEYKEYHGIGEVFLEYFAHKINAFPDEFKARNEEGILLTQAYEVIKKVCKEPVIMKTESSSFTSNIVKFVRKFT